MNEPNKGYLKLVHDKMPKSKHFLTMFRAFWVGGTICCLGQGFFDLYSYLMPNFAEQDVRALVTISLITLTAILTGLGIYDKIGAYAGAGSIVPITGFANAMVSPSIEHKREGIVLGLCSNMFTIAGPVIVFGISASFIVGLIVLTFKGAFI